MPKKKGKTKHNNADFTINDCANALKPVGRVKKSVETEVPLEKTWEDLQDDDLDIIEEVNADGVKNFVSKKKRNHSKTEQDDYEGIVYPEIVWYLISPYIKPEEIGNFARINKITYSITQRESFWRGLYRRYCQNNPKLPEKLRIENSYKLYGLRQRVIRALYHTYEIFVAKVWRLAKEQSCPHRLVKRRCVNVWYRKGFGYWYVYFKLKKSNWEREIQLDFIDELGRIDANSESDSQVLQLTCKNFNQVPPLMGMTLTSVSVALSQGFRHLRLHLGFNTNHYNVSRDMVPECTVVIDTVLNMKILDWWHPKYPNFEERLPLLDEESLPVLKKDFFPSSSGDS